MKRKNQDRFSILRNNSTEKENHSVALGKRSSTNVGMYTGTATMKIVYRFLKELKIELSYGPASPLQAHTWRKL